MKHLKNIFLCLCGLLVHTLAMAQADIHFSQFYETSILRNPALTGVFADDYKVGVYIRNQWSSISNPYTTELLSAETHLHISSRSEDFLSLGVLGYSDKAGSIDQTINAGYLAVSYNKSLSTHHPMFLSVGFTGGYLQYSIDQSKATFNNQYQGGVFNAGNPTYENIPNSKISMYDAAAGINFNTTRGDHTSYMLGISGYHFNTPNYSYYQTAGVTQNIRWNANAGLSMDVATDVNVVAQANYANQGPYTEIIMGGLVNWTAAQIGDRKLYVFSAGVLYRVGDAIIPVVKVTYMQLAFGLSYDVNVSTLENASNMQGGIEVTLFYSGNYGGNSDEYKKTVCPRFF